MCKGDSARCANDVLFGLKGRFGGHRGASVAHSAPSFLSKDIWVVCVDPSSDINNGRCVCALSPSCVTQ